ncbi:ORF57 [Ovine gammaherpesvirus 2]|uniref:ORF57 n=1 Tax=Ovine gammaherpesvirus 2 TaxID=10398 RepID=Q8JND2_9GAMA|nr:ORF57 [Ovine gammaherpesvirus 2]AAK97788.2 ORF57 [Ovine gammaherpesvirus 2]ABB22276.1 post transcriptional control protein-like protein [Ovine gammaherpesvirus 2]
MAQQVIVTMQSLNRTVEAAETPELSLDLSCDSSNDSLQKAMESDDEMETDRGGDRDLHAPGPTSSRKVFVIPKRTRPRSTVQHSSPLNKLYPNVVFGRHYNSAPRSNRYPPPHKRRRPEFGRHGQRHHNSRATESSLKLRHSNPEAAALIKDLNIPQSMFKSPSGQPFAHWLMPTREDSSKFLSINPAQMESETLANALVKRCAEWALISSRMQDKSISTEYIVENFAALREFAHSSVNKGVWVGMRKESITNTGLVNLCAFADEMLQWLQLNLQHPASWKACREDIFMAAAPEMCFHALLKIRGMLRCFLREPYQRALVDNLCYMVCFGGGIKEAANLCQELFFDFKLGLLVLYFMTPYAFLYSHTVPQCDFGPYFSRCVTQYTPGAVTGLLNSVIEAHFTDCTDTECSSIVTSILYPESSNRGLFFFPLPV